MEPVKLFYVLGKEFDHQGYDTAPGNDVKVGWRKRIYAKDRLICEKELCNATETFMRILTKGMVPKVRGLYSMK